MSPARRLLGYFARYRSRLIAGPLCVVDTDGDDVADSDSALAALAIDAAERATIAAQFTAGKTLWRVPVTHFSLDINWPGSPTLPIDATTPGQLAPFGGADLDNCNPSYASLAGSTDDISSSQPTATSAESKEECKQRFRRGLRTAREAPDICIELCDE